MEAVSSTVPGAPPPAPVRNVGCSPKTSVSLPAPAPTTTAPESIPTLTDNFGCISPPPFFAMGEGKGGDARVELPYLLEDGQAGPGDAFRIIFVGLRPPEIGHHPIAEILADMTAISGYRFGSSAMIGADHLTPFLGIELSRDARRVHEIAKQHRQMAPLAAEITIKWFGIA